MPLSKEHKQNSREEILKSAVKLFSQKGFDNVSIKDVMKYAGLTHGAFYAHFDSKEELYAHGIRNASQQSLIVTEYTKDYSGPELVEKIINGYLSNQHVSGEVNSCPLAFLATDVASKNNKIRTVYSEVYNNLVTLMEAETAERDKSNTDLMMAVTAMMIGGVAVSRALIDPEKKERLLSSCRKSAMQLASRK